nr:hypothetical protein [Tanacetum cinerariifolium]
VTVFEHPELTAPGSQDQLDANTREVLHDGTVFFPYVGRIQAGGKTVSQIREQLRMGLAPQYTEVKVDVKVLRYNSQRDGDYLHLNSNSKNKIYVLGEVQRPQVISFSTTSVTLLEALGTSGGLSPDAADGEAVYVIRAQDATHAATVYHLNAKKPTAYALAKGFE